MERRYRGKSWLRPGGKMQPWINALVAIDARRDNTDLVALLKSDKTIPGHARWHIADLLERHQLTRRRGGQATPSYDKSKQDMYLSWAADEVRTEDVTLEDAARTYGVSVESLALYLGGRHGSAHRMKKRRPRS
jgi:hypothetical protein